MMKKITILSFNLLAILWLAGCSMFSGVDTKAEYPKQPEDRRKERIGSLAGNDGLVLFGGKKDGGGDSSGVSGIGINSYLWRASLDTLSFMPMASADPFGGVIITDWYEDPAAKGERFKVNVLILAKDLRSDAVKVSVFKQSFNGTWRDASVNEKTARDLENKILTRARELRIEKEKK